MITFEQALEIAEKERNSKVISAGDLGDRWLFSFEDDAEKLGGAPMYIFKDSGNYEYVSSADYVDSLLKGLFEYQPICIER